jgi:hypothetical protein
MSTDDKPIFTGLDKIPLPSDFDDQPITLPSITIPQPSLPTPHNITCARQILGSFGPLSNEDIVFVIEILSRNLPQSDLDMCILRLKKHKEINIIANAEVPDGSRLLTNNDSILPIGSGNSRDSRTNVASKSKSRRLPPNQVPKNGVYKRPIPKGTSLSDMIILLTNKNIECGHVYIQEVDHFQVGSNSYELSRKVPTKIKEAKFEAVLLPEDNIATFGWKVDSFQWM